ncbi:formylglycine-generating enzyme family protein [Hymenobacter sp. B81]|uniref:formylglycine-generating enzyme family protein n=1 Tax=Hymenobacter sp. B81 TaxID=3344878 RepID=UPI0037DC227C
MTFWPQLRFLGVVVLMTGCASVHRPTSTLTGAYSATTALPLLPGTGPGTYRSYPDDRVLQFRSPDGTCPVKLPSVWQQEESRRPDQPPVMPGILLINSSGLGIDEAEISNQEWHQYQLHQEQAGVSSAILRPHSEALPVPDYYIDPFYRYYPVVGISREQAEAFCRWRSRIVTRFVNEGLHQTDSLAPNYLRCVYRLPTEAEWEQAANNTACTDLPVRVEPAAAAYLKRRSGSAVSEIQIKADIVLYNSRQPVRSVVNYQQAEPYFLQLPTPGYAYQDPANKLGVYHLFGNVAELVQEPGITKGGSYRDALEACTVQVRGTYAGPAPTVGFRCVADVHYPNRR